MAKKGLTSKNIRLRREDWIAAAREALIKSGVDNVKVEKLAHQLGVTRGSFYWHFKSRNELLDAVLADWEVNNTEPFDEALRSSDHNGVAEFERIAELWLEEKAYRPAYDSAIRDWARNSKRVARRIRRIDNRRIQIFEQIYLDLGYDSEEAFIRARITYFHQVGYYALGLGESKKERRRLAPLYIKILLGDNR